MEFDPEKGHLIARTIIEILGKPREHVEETIRQVVENARARDGIEILKEHIAEPKQVEGLWSVFAELEVLFKAFEDLAGFSFDFMPSSVEILEPENLPLRNNDISALFNDLLAGLHSLDMATKNSKVQATILKQNNEALLKNLVLVALHYNSYPLKELAGVVGLKELQLAPYLTRYMDEGLIEQDRGGQYCLVKKGK